MNVRQAVKKTRKTAVVNDGVTLFHQYCRRRRTKNVCVTECVVLGSCSSEKSEMMSRKCSASAYAARSKTHYSSVFFGSRNQVSGLNYIEEKTSVCVCMYLGNAGREGTLGDALGGDGAGEEWAEHRVYVVVWVE